MSASECRSVSVYESAVYAMKAFYSGSQRCAGADCDTH